MEYHTLELPPTEDIQAVLARYQAEGYKVVHAFYEPGGNYRFLLARPAPHLE